jgi:hypothetical protein
MIVDADTIEARFFAADNERCEIRQGPTDRNSESDKDPPHLTTFLISYQYSGSTPPQHQRGDLLALALEVLFAA